MVFTHCIFTFCFSSVSDSLEQETQTFLSQKSKWKEEIEEKLEKLKTVERSLSSKEQELEEVGAHTHTLTHSDTETHTHRHTHTCTYTHTHSHTQ